MAFSVCVCVREFCRSDALADSEKSISPKRYNNNNYNYNYRQKEGGGESRTSGNAISQH